MPLFYNRGILSLSGSYFFIDRIKLLGHFLFGSRSEQLYSDYEYSSSDECRQEFVYCECSAKLADTEFPCEDHNGSGNETGDSAVFIGAFPEQCSQARIVIIIMMSDVFMS